MVAAASPPIVRTAPVTAMDTPRTDLPPDDEPLAGSAPAFAPKPTPKGGGGRQQEITRFQNSETSRIPRNYAVCARA
jgi:hypothetical protein